MTKSSEKAVLRLCVGGYDHSVVAVEAEIQSLKPSSKPQALKRLFADCEHTAPVRCVAARDGLLATAGHDEIIRSDSQMNHSDFSLLTLAQVI